MRSEHGEEPSEECRDRLDTSDGVEPHCRRGLRPKDRDYLRAFYRGKGMAVFELSSARLGGIYGPWSIERSIHRPSLGL